MTQVLHLYNGETVNKKLAAAGSAAEKAMAETDNAKIVEDAVSGGPLALAHGRRAAAARRPSYLPPSPRSGGRRSKTCTGAC